MENRATKDILYEQVARIGKALSSPKRIELLGLLAQGEKSVEALAEQLSIEIKLASAHLKVLREACLVASRKEGKFVYYRLSGADVAGLWVSLRDVAQAHLVELQLTLDQIASAPDKLASVSREQLMDQAKRGEVIVIDVRPRSEFDHAHLPYARSMPLDEIEKRIAELPQGVEIVAYCRGPFCLFSEEAVRLLQAKGRTVSKLLDGVAEWAAAGMPLQTKETT